MEEFFILKNKTKKNYFNFIIVLCIIIVIIAIQYLNPNSITHIIITVMLGIETLVVVGMSSDIIEKLNENSNKKRSNLMIAILAIIVLGSSYLFY